MNELTEILWDWEIFCRRWRHRQGGHIAKSVLLDMLYSEDEPTDVDGLMTFYPASSAMWEIVTVLDPQLKKLVEMDS